MDIFSLIIDCIFLSKGANLNPKVAALMSDPVVQPFYSVNKVRYPFWIHPEWTKNSNIRELLV